MEPTRACVSASVATDPPTLNSWPHHPLLLTRRRRRLLRSPNQHLPGAHPFRFVFGQNFEIVDWGPAAESIHSDEANTLFFFPSSCSSRSHQGVDRSSRRRRLIPRTLFFLASDRFLDPHLTSPLDPIRRPRISQCPPPIFPHGRPRHLPPPVILPLLLLSFDLTLDLSSAVSVACALVWCGGRRRSSIPAASRRTRIVFDVGSNSSSSGAKV